MRIPSFPFPKIVLACRVCGARVTSPQHVICGRCLVAGVKKPWKPR